MKNKPLKIYIGWDSREDIAFQVAKQSLLDTTNANVDVTPIKQNDLRRDKIYTREKDILASTEFTFTRFLVPHLNKFKGWALFCDCDFLFLEDVQQLFSLAESKYAVMVAKHNYRPKNKKKMDGQTQLQYPRKNWSSLILWNCGHPKNNILTSRKVSDPATTGAFLHRFQWLQDEDIGTIPVQWNWLVDWYKEPNDGKPHALHFTEGGPWFENYKDCDYAARWFSVKSDYYEAMWNQANENYKRVENKRKSDIENDLTARLTPSAIIMSKQKQKIIKNCFYHLMDPDQQFYKNDIMTELSNTRNSPKIAAIYPDGNFEPEKKNYKFDEYLEAFAQGLPNGKLSTWEKEKDTQIPLLIRGLSKKSQLAIKHCWANDRLFYAVDTGYIQPGIRKEYHRITKNALQNLGPIIERPGDRIQKLNWRPTKFKNKGHHVLLCPPSAKVMLFYGKNLEVWCKETIKEIAMHTDRPVIVREKPIRSVRTTTDTIWEALKDAYCLVTFNSIAATESLLAGTPAIALAPNAASVLCNTEISKIENLNRPSKDEIEAFARHLSYCQFNQLEMQNGIAWSILNEGG